MKKDVRLIIHNVRSVYNVGAIFRTAEAAGISKIYLSGYTACPLDRFSRPRKDLAKAALGAEKMIAWESLKNPNHILKTLRKDAFSIAAIEQEPNSIDYKIVAKKLAYKKKIVFLLGNEVTGLSKKILAKCDFIAEIPMLGKKESLNVSVALGIALFRILKI